MSEAISRPISHTDLLQHMQVPGEPGLYVLGCFERRVTLLSQQVRALNLVYTLGVKGLLPPGGKVCVVGGGAAGMTVAAAAAAKGCDVVLLEKAGQVLPLFRGNHSRWLHPHIYDWPQEERGRPEGVAPNEAGLPLLSWRAAPAGEVARQLMEGWEALPGRSRIRVVPGTKSVHLGTHQGQRRSVSWNAPGYARGDFDAVVLAVGFGLEREVQGIDRHSYWDDDRLHQEVRNGQGRHLISGCGDGGLVDLLRVRLRDFRHESIVPDFLLEGPTLAEVKEELLRIEEDAQDVLTRQGEAASRALLTSRYLELRVPEDFDRAFEARLRPDTEAVLNGLDESPLSLHANILNRFLVSRLLVNGLEYRPGAFEHVKLPEGTYEVRFATGPAERFHRIICRHGPAPSALEEGFADIWRKCEPLRSRNELDQTRWPLWPAEYFGPAQGRGGGGSASAPGGEKNRLPPSEPSESTRHTGSTGVMPTGQRVLDDQWFDKEATAAAKGLTALGTSAHMELRFGLHDGLISKPQLDLLVSMQRSSIKTFGWPIGVIIDSVDDFKPRPYGDGVRAEIPIKDHPTRTSYDYWALRSNGDFFLAQSLFEDQRKENEIFFNTRIVRVTEALLFASNLYTNIGAPPEARLSVRVTHRGLANRSLTTSSWNRVLPPFPRISREGESQSEIVVILGRIKETLVDDVKRITEPMFMLFDFAKFKDSVYEDIVRRFEKGEVT